MLSRGKGRNLWRKRNALSKGKAPFVNALRKVACKSFEGFGLGTATYIVDPLGRGHGAIGLYALFVACFFKEGYYAIAQ